MVNKCCVPGCQSNYYCNNKSDFPVAGGGSPIKVTIIVYY